MRVLLTGSEGMLGTAIKKVFTPAHELILTECLDICSAEQVMSYARGPKPDYIIHAAAETDLSKAEANPGQAYYVNQTGTQNMVELARKFRTPIIYVSTAGVFDGKQKCYDERAEPQPIHHYGRSKYYGECAVQSFWQHIIIRCGWAMGGGPALDKKFVNKVYQQIQAGKKTLYGITDIFGNLSYTLDFARTLRNIVENFLQFGTYHAVGRGAASRYDILCAVVKGLGLSGQIECVPVTAAEFQKMFPMNYTSCSEVLSTEKLDKTGLSAMRDWRVSLTDYLKEFVSEVN